MIAFLRRITSARLILLPLAGSALLAGGCTLVGQGALHVQNDLSGLGADNTVIRFYAHNAGDTWPASGELGVLVQGDDLGSPPAFGLNGTLLLVSTLAECPMSEGAPETFLMTDVTTIGSVPVINGTVNQAFRIPDTGASRAPRWALIESGELAGYPGEHKIHRCGAVTFVAEGSATVDPCTLRASLEGNGLTAGTSFALNLFRKWQFCYGGAAAGSNEKFLFLTPNGGASWILISRTTLGAPPPETGVGELPNGNGVSAMFFENEEEGWLGLSSPGHNLLKSNDSGRNWKEVVVEGLDQGVPVTSIGFSTEDDGVFTTPDDTFTTDSGGTTWELAP